MSLALKTGREQSKTQPENPTKSVKRKKICVSFAAV
jgi:hypothetical protein